MMKNNDSLLLVSPYWGNAAQRSNSLWLPTVIESKIGTKNCLFYWSCTRVDYWKGAVVIFGKKSSYCTFFDSFSTKSENSETARVDPWGAMTVEDVYNVWFSFVTEKSNAESVDNVQSHGHPNCYCLWWKSKSFLHRVPSAYVEISTWRHGVERKCRSVETITYCSENHLMAPVETTSFQ